MAQKVPLPNRPRQKYLSFINEPGSGKGGWVDLFLLLLSASDMVLFFVAIKLWKFFFCRVTRIYTDIAGPINRIINLRFCKVGTL